MTKVIIRRFLELLIPCVAFSAIAVALNVYLFNGSKLAPFIIAFIAAVIWFAINVYMLRCCYIGMQNKKDFFIANFIAYALFGLCTVIVYLCFSKEVYSWVFAMTKFLRFTRLSDYFAHPIVYSVAIFHLLGGLMICLAPIGMSWVFDTYDDEENPENEECEE